MLLNFLPSYCPNCGAEMNLDLQEFHAHISFFCGDCDMKFQKAEASQLLQAATDCGGDLVDWLPQQAAK